MNETAQIHEEEQLEADATKIREQILHILKIYPGISNTMLQGALGPSTKAGEWKPILEELIEEGLIVRESTDEILAPSGRYNRYIKISLAHSV